MEKDDKIQHRQQQTQKYGAITVAAMVLVGVLHLLRGSSDTVPHEQALRLQNLQRKMKDNSVAPVQSATDLEDQKANLLRSSPVDTALIEDLAGQYKALDEEVRAIKKTGVIMETDPTSLEATKKLQAVARKLIVAKYGPGPYRVKVDLEFPASIPDFAAKGKDGYIVIELAPIEFIPVSVWTFLEVSRTWVRGSFHRNANHVLQVQAVSSEIHQHLPFQEYSKEFPHKKGTTGYCGRPSGPCWYVSLIDNTVNHVSDYEGLESVLLCFLNVCSFFRCQLTIGECSFTNNRVQARSNRKILTKQMPTLVES